MCLNCYFSHPEAYEHIAGSDEHQIDIVFKGDEIDIYNQIKEISATEGKELQEVVKLYLERSFNKNM